MFIALAQLNPRIGDVPANLTKIIAAIETAVTRGAKLVVLPELALVGYFPRDLLEGDTLANQCGAALKSLAHKFPGTTIVCGFVERNPSLTGKPLYNSLAVLRGGTVAAVYRKRLLPFYDVFEEERYFQAGQESLSIEIEGIRFGMTICEDVWNFERFVPRLYPVQPLDAYRKSKVDFLINLSASPYQVGKEAIRRAVMVHAATYSGAGVIHCNQVGGNDDLLFEGGSFVTDAMGQPLAVARRFEEDLLCIDLKSSSVVGWPQQAPDEAIASALTLGLADYVKKTGSSKVCLGLSGGIDSSVAALLAVEALGPQAVIGIALPTRYSSEATNRDAETLARKLGIEFRTLSIEGGFTWASQMIEANYPGRVKGLTLENIQPRLRMMMLMAVANQENALLLNTSNKSEMAMGYSTLYGDSAGALAVLGDLTKGQVYALGRTLDRKWGAIPENVFARAPSAELRENQTDQDSLPPYSFLDQVVQDQIERGVAFPEEAAADWYRFRSLYAGSEFKRFQAPPILRVSPRAFGRGRRIPLASKKTWEPSPVS